MVRRIGGLLLGLVIGLPALAGADERPASAAADKTPAIDERGIAFFEAKIRPVLVAKCYVCHSRQAGKSEGSLLLDSRDALRRGGDRGAVVVPGDLDSSVLLAAITHQDDDLKMPPLGKPLSAAVVADFREWIVMGAPDPRVTDSQPSGMTSSSIDLVAARQFWAYRKPVRSELPEVQRSDWSRRDLDRFILRGLEQAGLSPSPDAAPDVLLRRLHFDLIGLPPSPEDQMHFSQQIAARGFEAAFEEEVDRLLALPQFGERWGRHWLDVARFAESSGKEANISFPYAFRYRDYVFDCFNRDLPFDRFLTEQLAGDLLPWDSAEERARLLIATGFLAVGPKNLDEGNKLQFAADLIDEQIDTVTRALTANSVACARCHDHKIDPFRMEDYYALAGIFRSTKTYFGTFVSPANQVGGDPLPLPRDAGQPIFHKGISAAQVQKLKAELAELRGEGKPKVTLTPEELANVEFDIREILRNFWRTGAIKGQLDKVDAEGHPLPLAMGVTEESQVVDAPLLERGEVDRPEHTVARGFPAVFVLDEVDGPSAEQSGRLELARWLTHPDHPLTARVIVNRLWKSVFGAGLIRTVDNFGTSGESPSHPELLDELALRFVEGGWSIKSLVREMVLSRTYRQSSTFQSAAFLKDPENRLLWRIAKRRLDAEAIRDAMLAASGELDLARPQGSLVARVIGDKPISLIGLDRNLPADLDGAVHRSVYLPVIRDRLPDVLQLFDFAETSVVTGERETTNVPIQALYLMNSPFVQERAKALAGRLQREAATDADRIELAFRLCFNRPPDAVEAAASREYLNKSGNDAAERTKVLTSFCQALLATAEFRNLD